MTQDYNRASLELLLHVSRELANTLDLHTVLERVLTLSAQHVNAIRGSLVVLNKDLQPVDAALINQSRLLNPTIEQMEDVIAQGLAGWVMRNREAAFVPDTSQDERWLRREDDLQENTGAKSAMCVPLLAQDDIVGILTIVHPEPQYFTRDHLDLLQAIADIAGLAIRNAQLFDSMQTARRRYYELFEDSVDPIVLTNPRGEVLEANRQMIDFTGRPLNELKGRPISELHAIKWDHLGQDFSSLAESATLTYETTAPTAEQPFCPVQVYVRRISAENVIQWIFRDISERKQLDALREDLSAMVYHDLRSPLANIVSSLDILTSMLPVQEMLTTQPVFQIAIRSTERMQRLISSLLDINRLEAGRPVVNRENTRPEKLVRDAIDSVEAVISGKNQHLRVETEPDLPEVSVDEDMIRRVLINLLENATKFTPMHGDLAIRISGVDNQVRFSVEDSGPGIPAEAHDAIFDKFTRLPADGAPKGMGLGLSFCRMAVLAHGGKIWVENREPSGSRFIFQLPGAQQES